MIENKIAEMLGQLADKLGVASAKIWEWSLLQVEVEVVTNIIIILLAILTTVVFIKLLKKFDKATDLIEEALAVGLVVSGIAGIVLIIASVFAMFELPKLLINPEYAAFQNIIEQLGSLK